MNKKLSIDISLASVLKVTAVVLALAFIYYILDILILVFVAIFLSALLEPAVNFLESKKIPRVIGVILIYVSLLFVVAILLRLIIPPIIQQLTLLFYSFPGLWDQFGNNFSEVKQFIDQYGIHLNWQQTLGTWQSSLGSAASSVYAFTITAFQDVINIIFVLVLAFYLILEREAMHKVFRVVVPAKYLANWIKAYEEIEKKIGDWARGELILGLIIGLLSFVGLIFLVPKYALTLALIAGLMEMIPYFGPILSAIPAVFLGLMVPTTSLARGLAVLILFVVIQELENNIIVPQVMKKKVGISPVITLIAMLIGARVFGIIGIILAVPISTAIEIIFREVKDNLGTNNTTKIK
ncbi:MAG: AI-2E family transporter [Candidatus Buchananbacteria bacterium]